MEVNTSTACPTDFTAWALTSMQPDFSTQSVVARTPNITSMACIHEGVDVAVKLSASTGMPCRPLSLEGGRIDAMLARTCPGNFTAWDANALKRIIIGMIGRLRGVECDRVDANPHQHALHT